MSVYNNLCHVLFFFILYNSIDIVSHCVLKCFLFVLSICIDLEISINYANTCKL